MEERGSAPRGVKGGRIIEMRRNIYVRVLSLMVQADSSFGLPVFIWGPPGIGKSSTVKQLADLLGRHIEIVIAGSKDPADVLGIDFIIEDEHLGKISKKIPPSWAVRALRRLEKGQKTIVFFDELTVAPQMVQNVLLSTIQDRILGDISLPYEIYLCAAGNPPEISGETLSQAMANRFFHMFWEYEKETFQRYLRTGGVKIRDIAEVNPNYLKKYEELKDLMALYLELNDFAGKGPVNDYRRDKPHPTPRSVENMLKALSLVSDNDPFRREMEDIIADGTVGAEGFGFLTWIRKRDELPDVESVLRGEVSLPSKRLDIILLFVRELALLYEKNLEVPDFLDKAHKLLESIITNHFELTVLIADMFVGIYKKKNIPAHKWFFENEVFGRYLTQTIWG
ncbi:MAG: MoxR family ATPase [candidate division WOR-3 bacterium]